METKTTKRIQKWLLLPILILLSLLLSGCTEQRVEVGSEVFIRRSERALVVETNAAWFEVEWKYSNTKYIYRVYGIYDYEEGDPVLLVLHYSEEKEIKGVYLVSAQRWV